MGGVNTAVAGDHLAQRDDLLGSGESPGRVFESCGEPQGPLLKGALQITFHRLEFGGGGRTVLAPQHGCADGAVADQGRIIEGDPLL